MQLTFDSDVEEFRAEFSAFLDANLPSEAQTLERPRSVSHMPQWARDWQRLLFDNGWLLPAQPPEFGGRNASVVQTFVHLDEQCRRRIYHSFDPAGRQYHLRHRCSRSVPSSRSIAGRCRCCAVRRPPRWA